MNSIRFIIVTIFISTTIGLSMYFDIGASLGTVLFITILLVECGVAILSSIKVNDLW